MYYMTISNLRKEREQLRDTYQYLHRSNTETETDTHLEIERRETTGERQRQRQRQNTDTDTDLHEKSIMFDEWVIIDSCLRYDQKHVTKQTKLQT